MSDTNVEKKFNDRALVLLGENGLKLSIGRYTAGGEKRALILVEGVQGAWNGKVLDCAVENAAQDGENYVTDYDGKPWTALALRNAWGYGQYEAYVTDDGKGLRVGSSDTQAEATHPQAIYRVYQRQQAGGK